MAPRTVSLLLSATLISLPGCGQDAPGTGESGESGSSADAGTGSTTAETGNSDSTTAGDGDGDGGDTGDGGPSCGNDQVDGNEVCDGTDLNGEDCQALGYEGGELACQADCSAYDVSACEGASCGDNVLDPQETCDGTELNGQSCESLGFAGGQLGCSADCQEFDISQCEDGCDEAAAMACDEEAATGLEDCISQCGGMNCESAICEAECQLSAQEQTVSCYEQASCIFMSIDAGCVVDCIDVLVECAEEEDCSPQCMTDFDTCIGGC